MSAKVVFCSTVTTVLGAFFMHSVFGTVKLKMNPCKDTSQSEGSGAEG